VSDGCLHELGLTQMNQCQMAVYMN